MPDVEHGTAVVVPSATFPIAELRKIKAIEYYEERMLFTTLSLARPEVAVVYVTSLPVDEAVVDYYLGFLPDPADARRRLRMVALHEPGPEPLTLKLLRRPDVLDTLREAAGEGAFVLPFRVTGAEEDLADAVGLPLYGPPADLSPLGSKTGSRQVAAKAGVAVPAGHEGLRTLEEIEGAVEAIRAARPDAEAVVVKLDNGFSGQGNAIVDLGAPASPLTSAKTTFCAGEESWPSFETKIAEQGAIVEEVLRRPGVVSPSVQLRISPAGEVEVLSTHDQILGGPEDQVYLGCRFPADAAYRANIQGAALRVAGVLAGEGVLGSFGIDFLVAPGPSGPEVFLSEINLRLGGTTHPFWMAKLVTGARYDEARGELVDADGNALAYVATDNLNASELVGRRPAEVLESVRSADLAYDPATRRGALLHMLGALRAGKMGATCIAATPTEAGDLYRDLLSALGA